MGPALTTAVAALAVLPLALAIESAGHPPSAIDRRPAALLGRLASYAGLFLLCFVLCWRPILAAAAAVVTVGVVRVVSEKKRRLIGEPLLFSDFALIGQVVRHPDLYYVDARALLLAAALVAVVGAWVWIEPSALPAGTVPGAVALLGPPLIAASLGLMAWRLLPRLAGTLVAPFAPGPGAVARALASDEARLGLLLSVLLRLSCWVARRRGPVPRAATAAEPPLDPLPQAVVVVQIESFADPAAVPGGFPAPNLGRIRDCALAYGALGVPGHGAYTMRSEFAVLSGLEPAEIGEEGFDPYLSAASRGFGTLATALRARGHRTVFIHPFRRSFFGRDRVMPALGFDRLAMEDAFEGEERVGGLLSDAAVARRILAELDLAPGPALVYAVTMQNHGPWRVELDPPAGSPFERYRRHLADADRMIGMLLDGLEARGAPALLCVYGDHPPILDAVGPPTATPVAPYVVAAVGSPCRGARRDMTAAALGRLLVAWSGG